MLKTKPVVITLFFGTLFLLSACQPDNTLPPEKPLNSTSQNTRRVPPKRTTDIVPTLTVKQGENSSEFKLRSQTARYLNDQKSAMEITLADTFAINCQNLQIEPAADDQIFRFKISSTDGQALKEGAKLGAGLTVEGEINQQQLSAISEFTITTLNDAVIRGGLNTEDKEKNYQGDYFAAICR